MRPGFEVGVLALLAAAGTLTGVYWSVVLFHVLRTMLLIPTARRGLGLPVAAEGEAPPRVCVVVPAHNEEGCIGDVARTLAEQDYPALECVFVLDRCTDGTRAALEGAWAAVGGDAGPRPCTILELDSCPPGWVGKSHAVWTGAAKTDAAGRAELLLFVDADTALDPGLVRACIALMRERGVGLLSLLSTLTHKHWFEKVVQPAATMELLRQYPIVRANTPPSVQRRAFANGQFILIRRESYLAIGGHEAIHGCVLEDVELARRCAAAGVPAALLLADGLLHCRMYESYSTFERGWKRILGESSNRKPARLRRNARRVRGLCTVLPLAGMAGIVAGSLRLGSAHAGGTHTGAAWVCLVLCSLGIGLYVLVLGLGYRLGRTPLWTVPAFPVGSWLVGGIMRKAAHDLEQGRPTVWGGREYQRDVR